jgi:hypothetical protein
VVSDSSWSARSNSSWITILRTTSSRIIYRVDRNRTMALRMGTITVCGNSVVITQTN